MDKNEFLEVIQPFKNKLYGFAMRLLNNPEDVQDAMQEVLLKLWIKRANLLKEKNIEALAMRMMKNHCIDQIRKSNRKPPENEYLYSEHYSHENKDLIHQIKTNMRTLPEQQQIMIELKDFQGYSYEEISDLLGVAINTIRVNVSRGRKKMIKGLVKEWRHGR
jgi:RNA polymerase sigma-70 factor (ECF subfamily)